MTSLQETITAQTARLDELLREAEELRVDRAANIARAVAASGPDGRHSQLEVAGWCGVTHGAIQQTIKTHGPGTEKAKAVAAARRARSRASKKTAAAA